jgi:acyl-CoA dehydrogenase
MAFFDSLLAEEHLALRDAVSRWATREIRPHVDAWEEAGAFPRDLYPSAAAAGVLGVGFPEHLGGAGGAALHGVMVVEGLLQGTSGGVAAGLGSLSIALPPLVQAGSAELHDRFVRPTLRGELVAALAVTEPNTGSDVAGVRTAARLDGDAYIVDGAKMFITSGVRADFFTTLVRTGEHPHGGLSFLVIEASTPGVRVSPPLRKTGWWASDTAEIGFDGVRVPAANLVGEEGGAFGLLMRNFNNERLMLAAQGVAIARLALEEAARYARERHAFGRPISGFQVTRHRLAEMATRVLAAQTLCYQVAHRMDAGVPCVAEVSMLKNLASATAVDVCHDAVQLFGGAGYMRGTVVERLSRDARLLPIGGGTHEIMNEIVARVLDF